MVYGALFGIGWYCLYDLMLCPHGSKTFARHLAAYSIGGAVLAMTLYNPASFVYGGVLGLIWGNLFTI